MVFLKKRNITVPRSLEMQVIEELFTQVNSMLVRKIYGFLSIEDYRKGIAWGQKKKAQKRYQKIAA
jgi:hypothetical protein